MVILLGLLNITWIQHHHCCCHHCYRCQCWHCRNHHHWHHYHCLHQAGVYPGEVWSANRCLFKDWKLGITKYTKRLTINIKPLQNPQNLFELLNMCQRGMLQEKIIFRQCQIFLLDQDAQIDHTEVKFWILNFWTMLKPQATFPAMCQSIKCRTPRRDGILSSIS